jgi:hypothetical protein
MKRRSVSLDELWEEIKYAHEQRSATLPGTWISFWHVVQAALCWKAERS